MENNVQKPMDTKTRYPHSKNLKTIWETGGIDKYESRGSGSELIGKYYLFSDTNSWALDPFSTSSRQPWRPMSPLGFWHKWYMCKAFSGKLCKIMSQKPNGTQKQICHTIHISNVLFDLAIPIFRLFCFTLWFRLPVSLAKSKDLARLKPFCTLHHT